MINMVDYLRRVRERISREENWCQKHVAVNVAGEYVYVSSPKACRWCISGAMAAEHDTAFGEGWSSQQYQEAVEWVNSEMGDNMIVFNDTHTHAEVIAAVDRVITTLQSQETNPWPDEAKSSTL